MVIPKTYGRAGNYLFQMACAAAYAWRHGLEFTVPSKSTHGHEFWNPVYLSHLVNPAYDPSLETVEIKEVGFPYQELPFDESWRSKNIILNGYWQSEKYHAGYRERLLDAIGFPWILRSETVGVHVRRSDYLVHKTKHPTITNEWIESQMSKFPGATFVFFSDDIPYCKATWGHRDDCRFSIPFVMPELADHRPEVRDLVAMSMCQPAGTLIRTQEGDVAIENISVGNQVMSYSTASSGNILRRIIGRTKHTVHQDGFGAGRRVLSILKRQFSGELIVVKTDSKTTKYTPDHECIVRVGDPFKEKCLVYVMQRGLYFRVGITRANRWNSKHEGADIKNRFNAENADACWILKTFETLADALLEEEFASVKFGLPQIRFLIQRANDKGIIGQTKCDAFWERFGPNEEAAKTCLEHYGRKIEYPFVKRERHGNAKKNCGGIWIPETEKVIRACNLFDGMRVLDADIYLKHGGVGSCSEAWQPIQVSKERLDGDVYSLNVAVNHTYIGDGVVTHNCEHLIGSASTMSVWAGLLNRNPSARKIIPRQWIVNGWNSTTTEDWKDVVPSTPGWERA